MHINKNIMICFLIIIVIVIISYFLIVDDNDDDDDKKEHMTFTIGADKFKQMAKIIDSKTIAADKTTADSILTPKITIISPEETKPLAKIGLKSGFGLTTAEDVTVTNDFNYYVKDDGGCYWTNTPWKIMDNGGNHFVQLDRLLTEEHGMDKFLRCKDTEYMSSFSFEQKNHGAEQRFIVKCCPFGNFVPETPGPT